jgi:two-component system CheB/CheR fusion protein
MFLDPSRLSTNARGLPTYAAKAAAAKPDCELALSACPVGRLRLALAQAEMLLRQNELASGNAEIAGLIARRDGAARILSRLTPRQHVVMDMVLSGNPNKNIAADLRISQRTVETHRAAIMKRTGAKCLPDLARLGFDAAFTVAAPAV